MLRLACFPCCRIEDAPVSCLPRSSTCVGTQDGAKPEGRRSTLADLSSSIRRVATTNASGVSSRLILICCGSGLLAPGLAWPRSPNAHAPSLGALPSHAQDARPPLTRLPCHVAGCSKPHWRHTRRHTRHTHTPANPRSRASAPPAQQLGKCRNQGTGGRREGGLISVSGNGCGGVPPTSFPLVLVRVCGKLRKLRATCFQLAHSLFFFFFLSACSQPQSRCRCAGGLQIKGVGLASSGKKQKGS